VTSSSSVWLGYCLRRATLIHIFYYGKHQFPNTLHLHLHDVFRMILVSDQIKAYYQTNTCPFIAAIWRWLFVAQISRTVGRPQTFHPPCAQGRTQPVSLGGDFSNIWKSHYGFITIREMKYTSQHRCDKNWTAKRCNIANAVFRIVRNHGE